MTIAVQRDPNTGPFVEAVRKLAVAERRIAELEEVLDNIASRSIMDSVTAISMRAMASAVMPRRRRPL